MKKLQTILAAILSLAIIVAPQYPELVPAKYQVYAYLIIGVYEVFARVIPTTKNISLLSQAMQLLTLLVPNKATQPQTKQGKTHE